MEQHGVVLVAARRSHRSPTSTCSIASACSSSAARAARARLPGAEDRARAHHDAARPRTSSRAAPAERRRHDHAAAPAVIAQRALRRRPAAALYCLPMLKREAHRAGAGRGGDVGQPEVLPRHRLARRMRGTPRKTRAAAPAAIPRRSRSSSTPRRSSRRRARPARRLREPLSARTFYGLPRNARHSDAQARAAGPLPADVSVRRAIALVPLRAGETACLARPKRRTVATRRRRVEPRRRRCYPSGPKPARPSLPGQPRRRGKSGLRRAGCRVTPGRYKSPLARRMKARNRATETSRPVRVTPWQAGETRQPPSGATPSRRTSTLLAVVRG